MVSTFFQINPDNYEDVTKFREEHPEWNDLIYKAWHCFSKTFKCKGCLEPALIEDTGDLAGLWIVVYGLSHYDFQKRYVRYIKLWQATFKKIPLDYIDIIEGVML